jgi:hypothetical protein
VTYALGQVEGIEVYHNDAVVKRKGYPIVECEDIPRKEIKELSKASRRRLAFVASNTAATFHVIITLTYPKEYPLDGREVKKHLNAYLTWLRRTAGRLSYLWFLEFQKRGAPHVHILSSHPSTKGAKLLRSFRFRTSAKWYDIVGSEDYKHLQAGTNVQRIRTKDGAAHYAVKYAQKTYQKIVPENYRNVGRFWGASRDVKPQPEQFIRCTEDDIRGAIEDWRYAPSEHRPLYRVLYNQGNRFRDLASD